MEDFLVEVLDETGIIATKLYRETPQISGVVFLESYMKKL